jgi:sulfur-oxidizing protein SoxY
MADENADFTDIVTQNATQAAGRHEGEAMKAESSIIIPQSGRLYPAPGRRRFLGLLGAVLAGFSVHEAWGGGAGTGGGAAGGRPVTFDQAWQALVGPKTVAAVPLSHALQLQMPAIAEDGSLVPVTLASDLASTQALHLLVVNNPWPLVASFRFAQGMRAKASLRIRMQQDSEVILLAETADGWYRQVRLVKVLLGGCG